MESKGVIGVCKGHIGIIGYILGIIGMMEKKMETTI